jgi:hypothetical protein
LKPFGILGAGPLAISRDPPERTQSVETDLGILGAHEPRLPRDESRKFSSVQKGRIEVRVSAFWGRIILNACRKIQ